MGMLVNTNFDVNNMALGSVGYATVTVVPETFDQSVYWSSDNVGVADISQYGGVITAHNAGTATITCTSTKDGTVKISFKVTVTANGVIVPTLSLKSGINRRGHGEIVLSQNTSLSTVLGYFNNNSADLRLYRNYSDAISNYNPIWGGGINYSGYVGSGMTIAVNGVLDQYGNTGTTSFMEFVVPNDVTGDGLVNGADVGTVEQMLTVGIPYGIFGDTVNMALGIYPNGGYYGEPITTATQATQIKQNFVNQYKPIVMANPVYINNIAINGGNIVLSTSTAVTQNLTATISPSNASYPFVTWSSSDSNIATIYRENGIDKVFFCGLAGFATITATAMDGSGVVGSISIIVTSPTTPVYIAAAGQSVAYTVAEYDFGSMFYFIDQWTSAL